MDYFRRVRMGTVGTAQITRPLPRKPASATRQNTRHKQYLVWRQRMELISSAFGLAAAELDEVSDVVGTQFRDFGVIDYADWDTICMRGYLDQSWLFSNVFLLMGSHNIKQSHF